MEKNELMLYILLTEKRKRKKKERESNLFFPFLPLQNYTFLLFMYLNDIYPYRTDIFYFSMF